MRPGAARLVAFLPAAVALVLCWSATWFLCDDAFISFRYVGNLHDGHGLVWNHAPWQPVEGYSNFLWVALLALVWQGLGVEPPAAANWLSLGCALGTLWLCARAAFEVPLPERLQRARPVLAGLVLLGIATNHTFATWASSGLETALFGLAAVAWTFAVVRLGGAGGDGARGWTVVALAAAVAALTRPDGALLVLATGALAAWSLVRRQVRPRALAAGLWPVLAPVAHVLWRRAYYGEWLPNTYYAKVVAAWPESGWRYLRVFLAEHGGWPWLLLAVVGGAVLVRRGALRAPRLCAAATWSAFVGYYTLVVGGDHFAFRPFAHLVPLGAVAALPLAAAVLRGPSPVALLLAAGALLANWFPWWCERQLAGHGKDGFVRAAAALPAPLGGWCAGRDRDAAWLRLHYVALPRALHAATCDELLATLPPRGPGHVVGLPPGQRGVYRTVAAGVVGWVLADVDVLDAVGLNDRIVARCPAQPAAAPFDPAVLPALFAQWDADHDGGLAAGELAAGAAAAGLAERTGVMVSAAGWAELLLAFGGGGERLDPAGFAAAAAALQDGRHMAHERTPPDGYEAALRPNVVFDGRGFRAAPGVAPLSDAEVVEVERRFGAASRGR